MSPQASPKKMPAQVYAARQPADAEHGVGATLALGAELRLQVIDCFTGRPVVGAAACRIDVEEVGDRGVGALGIEDAAFDLPYPPPPWKPRFGDEQEQKYEAATADLDSVNEELNQPRQDLADLIAELDQVGQDYIALEDPTDEEREEIRERFDRLQRDIKAKKGEITQLERKRGEVLGRREKLIRARRERKEWVSYLQSALTALGRYTGQIDGTLTAEFADTLKASYKKLFGRTYRIKNKSHRRVAERLYQKIAESYVTDENGVLRVPLPGGATGTVTIEFSHIKIIDPLQTDNFLPMSTGLRSVCYDPEADEALDLPGSAEMESGWRLCEDGNEVPFQNFVELSFDTTDLAESCRKPWELRTQALVHCQPAWLPLEADEYWLEEGDQVENTRKGVANGRPTLLISSSKKRHGRRYGEWGPDGRRYPATNFRRPVKKLDDKFYVFHAVAGEAERIATTKQEAQLYLNSAYPDPIERLCRKVVRVRKWRGAPVPPAEGEEAPADQPNPRHYYVVRYREAEEHPSQAAAEAAASRDLGKKRKSYIVKKDDQWWVYREKEIDNDFHVAGPFRKIKQAKAEFDKKMHHGIDIAGNEGDRVFALSGGKTRTAETQGGGGNIVAIYPWRKEEAKKFQYLHMKEFRCEKDQLVKAGDIVGLMGRTGNPTKDSPTHVHIQARDHSGNQLSMAGSLFPNLAPIFPHNKLPKLLPCAGDYGEHNDDANCARQCRARHTDNRDNSVPRSCWAYREGQCPYAAQYEKSLREPPPVRTDGKYKNTIDVSHALEAEFRSRNKDYGTDKWCGHQWHKHHKKSGRKAHADVYVCTSYVQKVLRECGYPVHRDDFAKGTAERRAASLAGSTINISLPEINKAWKDYKAEHSGKSRSELRAGFKKKFKRPFLRKILRKKDPRIKGVVHALVEAGLGIEIKDLKTLQPGDCVQWWDGLGGHCVLVGQVKEPGKVIVQHGCHTKTHGVGDHPLRIAAVDHFYAVRPVGNLKSNAE